MKKEIRKKVLEARYNLDDFDVLEKSILITEKVIEMDLLEENMNVMLYMDFRNEVMTEFLIEYVKTIKANLILPKVDFKTHTMTLHRVNSIDSLTVSKYGILEPTDQPEVTIDELDIILAPGVAFDHSCYRLGYGGGFYDQLLAKKRKEVPVIALAFNLQVIEKVPTEPHDIQLDMVITESEVISKRQ